MSPSWWLGIRLGALTLDPIRGTAPGPHIGWRSGQGVRGEALYAAAEVAQSGSKVVTQTLMEDQTLYEHGLSWHNKPHGDFKMHEKR